MAGEFPGAKDIEQYWQNLVDGQSSLQEVPKERWDWQAYCEEQLGGEQGEGMRWGGFIDHVSDFDHEFFGIAEDEVKLIDPQQRLFLQTVWQATRYYLYHM